MIAMIYDDLCPFDDPEELEEEDSDPDMALPDERRVRRKVGKRAKKTLYSIGGWDDPTYQDGDGKNLPEMS